MPSVSEAWSKARGLCATDITPSQAKRFWERVEVSEISETCWTWTGYRNVAGYGVVGIGTKARPRSVLAHRLSYALIVGQIPDRLFLLHSCDNPPCVRPTHLSLGTHAENQRQKAERGGTDVRGEKNPRARLSAADVVRMRVEYQTLPRGTKKHFHEAMAERHGVTPRAIRAAMLGESWKTDWLLQDGPEAVREALGL